MKIKKEYAHLEVTLTWNGITRKFVLGELTEDELDELTMKGIDLSKLIEFDKGQKYKGVKHGRKRSIQDTVAKQNNEDSEDLSV